QEAGLLRGLADVVALGVDDPGPGHVVEERPPVLLEDDLLAELEVLDAGVLTVPVARPLADQPGEPGAVGVDVVRDLERHGVNSRERRAGPASCGRSARGSRRRAAAGRR